MVYKSLDNSISGIQFKSNEVDMIKVYNLFLSASKNTLGFPGLSNIDSKQFAVVLLPPTVLLLGKQIALLMKEDMIFIGIVVVLPLETNLHELVRKELENLNVLDILGLSTLEACNIVIQQNSH